MFCIYCGYSISENARYCPRCGRVLPILSEAELRQLPDEGPGPLTENIKEQIYRTCYVEVYREIRILTADEKMARASVKTAFDKIFKSSSVERNEAQIVAELKKEARISLRNRMLSRNPFLFSGDEGEKDIRKAAAAVSSNAGKESGAAGYLTPDAVGKQLDYLLKVLPDRERYVLGLSVMNSMSDEEIASELEVSTEDVTEARISAANQMGMAFSELKKIGVVEQDTSVLPYFRDLTGKWEGDASDWEVHMIPEFEAGENPMAVKKPGRLRQAEKTASREEENEEEEDEDDERDLILEKQEKTSSRNSALLFLVILIVAIIAVAAVIFVPRIIKNSQTAKEDSESSVSEVDTEKILQDYAARLTYINGRYNGYFRKAESGTGMTYVCAADYPGGNIASSVQDFDGDGESEMILITADQTSYELTVNLLEVVDEKVVTMDSRSLGISCVPETESGYVSLDITSVHGTPALSAAELAQSTFYTGRDVLDVRAVCVRDDKLVISIKARAINDSETRITELRRAMTDGGITSSADFNMTMADWEKMIGATEHLTDITAVPGDYIDLAEWYSSARNADLYGGVITFGSSESSNA